MDSVRKLSDWHGGFTADTDTGFIVSMDHRI